MKLSAFKTELRRLVDRTQDVRACVGRIADAWKYNLADRSFGPAYLDPETNQYTTELDLAVFMSALADRRAVITLPTYKGRRAASRTEGEVVVSKENRHGRCMRLVSNQDLFSFSVLVDDANVITASEVGKSRAFMLQDLDGTWHDGWRSVSFIADTDAEKKLFERAHKVSFDYFVHPNRWSSFYSRPYLLAKVAIERLTDQDRFLKAEQHRLRKKLKVEPPVWAKSEKVGEEKKEQFWAFNAVLDGVELQGEYAAYPTTAEGLEDCTLLRKRVGELLTSLRFHTRATEYAFWKHGIKHTMTEDEVLPFLKGDTPKQLRKPAWTSGSWETGYKETPRARTFWATIERDEGLVLRWRAWKKTERVAA